MELRLSLSFETRLRCCLLACLIFGKELREYFSVDVPTRKKVVDFLTNIGEIYAPDVSTPARTPLFRRAAAALTDADAARPCVHVLARAQWEPSADLQDPKDENLIDVENSYLARPGQFEPGYGGQPPNAANPNASAPPPMDPSLLAFADFPGAHPHPSVYTFLCALQAITC